MYQVRGVSIAFIIILGLSSNLVTREQSIQANLVVNINEGDQFTYEYQGWGSANIPADGQTRISPYDACTGCLSHEEQFTIEITNTTIQNITIEETNGVVSTNITYQCIGIQASGYYGQNRLMVVDLPLLNNVDRPPISDDEPPLPTYLYITAWPGYIMSNNWELHELRFIQLLDEVKNYYNQSSRTSSQYEYTVKNEIDYFSISTSLTSSSGNIEYRENIYEKQTGMLVLKNRMLYFYPSGRIAHQFVRRVDYLYSLRTTTSFEITEQSTVSASKSDLEKSASNRTNFTGLVWILPILLYYSRSIDYPKNKINQHAHSKYNI